ncbi:hypothetical protein CR513_01754, partial [Mucuna pruriens]
MTRSNPSKLYPYDLEIDKTFHRLIRSLRNSEVANNSHNDNMADNIKILKELATPDIICQS